MASFQQGKKPALATQSPAHAYLALAGPGISTCPVGIRGGCCGIIRPVPPPLSISTTIQLSINYTTPPPGAMSIRKSSPSGYTDDDTAACKVRPHLWIDSGIRDQDRGGGNRGYLREGSDTQLARVAENN